MKKVANKKQVEKVEVKDLVKVSGGIRGREFFGG